MNTLLGLVIRRLFMETQKEAKIKILVELDALLDTRLGSIAFLNPQVADSILENSASYVERKSDEFDRVIDELKNSTVELMNKQEE